MENPRINQLPGQLGTMVDLKNLLQIRIIRRTFFILCGLVLLLVAAVTWRFYWLNDQEQKLVGNWVLVKRNDEDFDRFLCIRFNENRSIGGVNYFTGQVSCNPGFWYLKGEQLVGVEFPQLKDWPSEAGNWARRMIKLAKEGSDLQILKLTDKEMLLKNSDSVGTFRKMTGAELAEYITERKAKEAQQIVSQQTEISANVPIQ